MKSTMKKTSLFALASLTASLSSSCVSAPLGTATNTYVGNQAGKLEEYLGDRDLAHRFVLLNTKTERKDERLRVQFDLKNMTSTDLAIEWSLEWKDSNGFRIDTNPQWRPAVIAGQGFQSIQAIGPVPEAAMFQLQVRKPTAIR